MNQIVLKIGNRSSEFYFPQNASGFEGIEEVIMDIEHNEAEAEKAKEWCKTASLGERYEREKFNLEIRA